MNELTSDNLKILIADQVLYIRQLELKIAVLEKELNDIKQGRKD